MLINLSNGTSYEGKLVVRHDWASPYPHRHNWRLAWANPDGIGFVNAEGECSAIHYRTMRQAISAGIRRYSEIAEKVDW